MNTETQKRKAEAFRAMHDRKRILVLPNAWDAASARIFEAAGFGAVATSSAAVANSLGYADGQDAPIDEMVAAVARIARAIEVPLTADFEAGYATDTAGLTKNVEAVIRAGAIGINLEDQVHDGTRSSLYSIEDAVARVNTARDAGSRAGVPLVINARTDVFLLGIGEKEKRFDHAVQRGRAYRAAGADSIFVPGVRDPETIQRLTSAIDAPINILAGAGTPPASELEKLGVARVSVGGGPALAALTMTRRIAEELRDQGTFTLFTAPGTITHPEANAMMKRRS
jgi:2-methylisocitrate lyase-like PEP mutase family enzyme